MTPSKILSNTTSALFFAFLCWTVSGCAAKSPPIGEANVGWHAPAFASQAECLPGFPDEDGWYGADAAYSLALPDSDGRSSLWLFGDSFVARPDSPEGRSFPFVHNSIGLSHCGADGRWSLETFWGEDREGQPRGFFVPDASTDWVQGALARSDAPPYYWPLDGFVIDDVLFVGLLRVIHSEPRGPFNLPFRLAGVDLARISNFRAPPSDWRIEISTLSDERDAFPGTAFVVTPDFLYAFAFLDGGDGRAPRMLSRLGRDALDEWRADLSGSLETLASDGNWRAGFDSRGAAILMPDDASEMSIHFDPGRRLWVAVYSDLSPRSEAHPEVAIRARSAVALVGPWSEPADLAIVPETTPGHARSGDKNLFCYAGKAHAQFSTATELVVTYVCNLYAREPEEAYVVLERLRESPDLYRPRALSIELPAGTLREAGD
jgi:hypothetical protein